MKAIRDNSNSDIMLSDPEEAAGFDVMVTGKVPLRDGQELAEYLGRQRGVGDGCFCDLNSSVNLAISRVVIL